MIKAGISKTSRVLSLYHLFTHCREVSICEVVPAVSAKTFFRDIKLLENAGVLKTRYSKKDNAYIPIELTLFEPNLPEGKPQGDYIKKIRRLCILMNELYDYEDEKPLHIELYQKLFPDVKDRTRQRDFSELAKLGFIAHHYTDYIYEDEDDIDGKETWIYRFEIPNEAYDIETIEAEEW